MTTDFPTRTGPQRSGASPGWLRVVLLLVLACVLAQGAAIQAHQHASHWSVPAVATTDEQGSIGAAGKAELRAVCPICVEAAMSGHYLQPTTTAFPAPPVLVLGVDPQSIPEFRLLSRAIGWLSRAPPQ